MAYFAPYIDASGIHMPTYEDRLQDLCSAYRSIFGLDAELSALRDQFLRSALLQWLKPGKWLKYSSVWQLLRDESTSDLSFRNWRWIVRVLSKAEIGSLRLELLPGQAELYEGFPVYMPDTEAAAPLLDAFSPYE